MHLLFVAIGDMIARFFIQKAARWGVNLAIIFAYAASIVTLSILFFNAIDVLLYSVSFIIPSEYLELVSVFFPSNLHVCFSIVISARILKMSLVWSLRMRQVAVDVSTRT